MDLGLTGKRAVVLGASRGLGRGIAKALAVEGAAVLLCARAGDRLEATVSEIVANGGKASAHVVDMSDAGCVASIVSASQDELGGVDVLVNNSGGPPPGGAADTSAETLETHFRAMVMHLIGLSTALLPAMRERKWGRILNIASSGVVQPIPNLALSNTLRASLVAWSKTLASEVAKEGVTVNTLLPGRIHTERVDALDAAASKRTGKSIEEVAAASRASIPAGRYGTVDEFAAVAAFLAGTRASYVTGSVVRIDGGMIRGV